MSNILIIDDDNSLADLLCEIVERMGHEALCSHSAHDGLNMIRRNDFDVVFLDVGLPDADGLQILPSIRETAQAPEVVILTGNGNPDAAELAIKNGAWDYLVKPSSVENIMLTVQRALDFRKQKEASASPMVLDRDAIVGESASMNAIIERVAQAASVEANVLISGETGTGKELLAHTIHKNSSRAKHPFVVVDCAALPESLVESVLFGHAKGAFTGAEKKHQGLIRQAHGGTLFLDEVGELPPTIQKAFLRVIQERRFRPVSGQDEVEVNFRLIAATNRNLEDYTAKGHFRSDLLFRLRSIEIEAPPLRHRRGDIKRLSIFYLMQLSDIYGNAIKGISNDFIEALEHYHWPGNVRELFHTLEEATAMAGNEPTLYPHCLPTRIRAILTRRMVKACTDTQPATPPVDINAFTRDNFINIQAFRDSMERSYLERLNLITHSNRKEACRISGLSRTRLFELLKKHNLANPRTKNHFPTPLAQSA